jgi:hypothetical protein
MTAAAPDAPRAAAPPSTPSASTVSPAGTERRPLNPFLANDPNQKARRLARALVSDMIAYHPQKREEGMLCITLVQFGMEKRSVHY